MSKPWIGYLSSALLLFAGVFMIAGHKPVAGVIFIVAALLGVGLQIFMRKNKNT